jgi:hypothetical protein
VNPQTLDLSNMLGAQQKAPGLRRGLMLKTAGFGFTG